ncbi:MAG: hypothetical protein IKQ10_11090 [Oscillospiraceae bacterium]|nr:hypothetical protein [Oscillospiraceae bacterium]
MAESEEKRPAENTDARAAARNAARRQQRLRYRKLQRSKKRWRLFLLIYTLVFLTAGAVGCVVLYRYSDAYERSIPEHVMDDFMAATTQDQWYAYIRQGAELPESAYEDTAAIFDEYYDAAIRGQKFTYWKNMAEYTADTPSYKVRGGGMDLAVVRLSPKGENAAGFGRQLWQVSEVVSVLQLDHLESVTVEVDAPRGDPVYINGVPLGDDALTGEAAPAPNMSALEGRFDTVPSFARYRVKLHGDITVTDKNGRALSPIRTEGSAVVRYVAQEDELYSFTVRAPDCVTVTVCGAELTAEDAASAEDGILGGLNAYTGGAGYKTLTYSFDGLYTPPEITGSMDGRTLTPIANEKGELFFFPAQDDALAAQVRPRVQEFFNNYINYSSQIYNVARHHALLGCILEGTELYSYVRDSRDAMIWASATRVTYDELTFADFCPVGPDCFTCTIRYKADFNATSWYTNYSYDLRNAYELAFVRSGNAWYAAAMSVVAG